MERTLAAPTAVEDEDELELVEEGLGAAVVVAADDDDVETTPLR